MSRLRRLFTHPGSIVGAVTLLCVGGVGGIIFWGGFNTAMEATNTMEFCISCHEMESTVYQEYKGTVHYTNASGVRATCADCHVPDDWVHKVVRKVSATKELYHHFAGTISTPEKFEAHRLTMAERVWASMEASDSRECRNCHSYEAMAFHLQGEEASTRMQDAFAKGDTCISCHKGIAHQLPDMTAGYKRLHADLVRLAAREETGGEQLYTISTTPLFLDATAIADGGRGDGSLLPATELAVLDRSGGAVHARLEGWQQDGADRVIYALMGRRILEAALRPDAIDRIERHETLVDPDTDLTWHRVSLDVWVGPDALVSDADGLWEYGRSMYRASCSTCHTLDPPHHHLANQWTGIVKSMERFIALDKEETRFLQKYLQLHARDVVAHHDGGATVD